MPLILVSSGLKFFKATSVSCEIVAAMNLEMNEKASLLIVPPTVVRPVLYMNFFLMNVITFLCNLILHCVELFLSRVVLESDHYVLYLPRI